MHQQQPTPKEETAACELLLSVKTSQELRDAVMGAGDLMEDSSDDDMEIKRIASSLTEEDSSKELKRLQDQARGGWVTLDHPLEKAQAFARKSLGIDFINLTPHSITIQRTSDSVGEEKNKTLITIPSHTAEYGLVRAKVIAQERPKHDEFHDIFTLPTVFSETEITGLRKPLPEGSLVLTSAICAKVLAKLYPDIQVYAPDSVFPDGFIWDDAKKTNLIGTTRLIRYLPNSSKRSSSEAKVTKVTSLIDDVASPHSMYNLCAKTLTLFDGNIESVPFARLHELNLPQTVPLRPMKRREQESVLGRSGIEVVDAPEFDEDAPLEICVPKVGAGVILPSPALTSALAASGYEGRVYTLDLTTAYRNERGQVCGAQRLIWWNFFK